MKIGILDDRPKELATTKSIIERNLDEKGWTVVEVPLEPTPARVVEWLAHEKIVVLVIDQVLSDASRAKNVNYLGTEVIKEIRKQLPDMPVYMITAHDDNPDVKPNLGKMDYLVRRGLFGKEAPVLIPRMIRAGATFEQRHRQSLSRLSALSQKNALDTLTAAEREELKSLQMSMALVDTATTRDVLLPELEREVKKFAELRDKAKQMLGVKGKAKK